MSSRFSWGWPATSKWLLDVWPLAPAVLLLWPLLTHGGYPLSRDLVFTPSPPFTSETLGLGGEPPRAVPLDALVWLGSSAVGGEVLARVALLGALLIAGWGAHRMIARAPFAARLLVAGLAVWNPYTVERLALGQWALLLGYAALWWLIPAAAQAVELGGSGPLARVVLWAALASITPSGGVVAVIVVGVMALDRSAVRHRLTTVSLVALLQLPWVLPGLVGAASQPVDPDGMRVFAAEAESGAGVVVSLLGLGGIWDGGSVPPSRESPLLPILTVVLLAAGLLAMTRSSGWVSRRRALVALGALGLAMSAATSVPGLREVLTSVASVPGVALLRDAQKWILLLAPLALVGTALLVGFAAERVRAGLWPAAWVTVALFAPLLLLPDGATTVSGTVRPVTYPSDFERIDRALEQGHPGAVAVLPWRSYRVFSWGSPSAVYDPASRWFDREVVRDDSLLVGKEYLAGESRRAQLIGSQVADGVIDAAAQRALVAEGVGWLVVYTDDPAAEDLDLARLRPVAGGADVALYSLGTATWRGGPGFVPVAVVVLGNIVAAGVVLWASTVAVRGRVFDRRRPA